MKTTLLLFISLLCLNITNAQLTKAQVYDFQVGDVFQVKTNGAGVGPKPIETDTIVAKYYSSGMDTLVYVKKHLYYVGPFMQNPPIFNYSIDTVLITNLNAPAGHFTDISCLPATDTMMIDSCGNSYERLHSNSDTSCFEPLIWYSDLFLGLGGPYYYKYDGTLFGTGIEWYSKTLTYYHSNQYGECGTYQPVASLNDLVLDEEVKIFPVPATSEIQLEANLPITAYTIYSISCLESIQKGTINSGNTIDVSSLKSGIYLLELRFSDSMKTVRFIKQ
jgi:hypothetical protein